MNLTYTSKHVFPQIPLLNFKARLKSHLDKPGSCKQLLKLVTELFEI